MGQNALCYSATVYSVEAIRYAKAYASKVVVAACRFVSQYMNGTMCHMATGGKACGCYGGRESLKSYTVARGVSIRLVQVLYVECYASRCLQARAGEASPLYGGIQRVKRRQGS